MKLRTSNLQGPALDWAVAKCEPDDKSSIYFDESTGEPLCHDDWPDNQMFQSSTDWSQGGPIIEREGMQIYRVDGNAWGATIWWDDEHGASEFTQQGPTPLIAAMRCYVASKLGDEVEVPASLVV